MFHEALAKNESLQDTSFSQEIMKLTPLCNPTNLLELRKLAPLAILHEPIANTSLTFFTLYSKETTELHNLVSGDFSL